MYSIKIVEGYSWRLEDNDNPTWDRKKGDFIQSHSDVMKIYVYKGNKVVYVKGVVPGTKGKAKLTAEIFSLIVPYFDNPTKEDFDLIGSAAFNMIYSSSKPAKTFIPTFKKLGDPKKKQLKIEHIVLKDHTFTKKVGEFFKVFVVAKDKLVLDKKEKTTWKSSDAKLYEETKTSVVAKDDNYMKGTLMNRLVETINNMK